MECTLAIITNQKLVCTELKFLLKSAFQLFFQTWLLKSQIPWQASFENNENGKTLDSEGKIGFKLSKAQCSKSYLTRFRESSV